jgi:murein DD-endopeptidase MepM/ murein hydrolase activator NlpD
MPTPRRTSVIAVLAAACLLAVAGASGQSLGHQKETVDTKIAKLRGEIASAKEKEGVLTSQIAAASDDISSLTGNIDVLSGKLAALEADLARHRARLAALEERYAYQTLHLRRLVRDHAHAQGELERRLVELYESDQVDAVEILLGVDNLTSLMEQIDFMNEIGRQDQRIAAEVRRLKIAMREARERTGELKAEVADATAVLATKTEETRSARAQLIAQQSALEAARADKQALLTSVRSERHEHEEDVDALLASSAELASRIQAAQAAAAAEAAAAASSSSSGASSSGGGSSSGGAPAGGGGASSSGLIWPVSGVVTSGFGYRWGRMHQGIDISAPTGTSVRAAASGRVIMAGWMGGYGNLVVIDHGNGLATAYAHLSSIWAGSGSVSQGQGIGAVGCTGSCTGAHLHFEVRVNGSPVDPLSYL